MSNQGLVGRIRSDLAVAILSCLAVSACGDSGPQEPSAASVPDLFGSQLYRADGSTVGIEALDGVAVIGIFFASHSCPACGGFTPLLLSAYEQLAEDGQSFEVVLVSLGASESMLLDYMTDWGMPWLAMPSQGSLANRLAKRYDVRWIPTLIIIDSQGNTISVYGREELAQEGVAAYDGWLASAGG